MITLLGEEGAGLSVSRAFLCLFRHLAPLDGCVRVSFCHFSLSIGVGDWLRFVILALPGHFY